MSGPKFGVINIRWDDQTASYRVDRPNWNGGKVVAYEDLVELIEAADDMLCQAYRGPDQDRLRAALSNITGATK